MFALNSGRSRDEILAACAREMSLFCALNQHTIEFVHQAGVTMHLSDALSRSKDINMVKKAEALISKKGLIRTQPARLQYLMSPI